MQYCTIASCLYRGSYYGGGGDAILSVAVKLTCPTVIACFNEIVHYVKVFLHPGGREATTGNASALRRLHMM